jgi:hypothetical protein
MFAAGCGEPAQRAFGDDPGARHRQHWCRDVFAAALAAQSVVAEARFRQIPHGNSIGEQKEKISTTSGYPTIRPEPVNECIGLKSSFEIYPPIDE